MESAYRLANAIPQEALASVPILQGFIVVPYWAMVRFGEWDRILSDAGPRQETPFTLAVWRYARAMALTAKDRLEEAEQELATLKTLVADPALDGQTTFSNNTGKAILRIAPLVVAGEIAAKRKDWDAAVLHLDRAIRYEDSLIYQEPHDWHAPVRQNLAAVLMATGRADEAETVLWEDLKRNPENVWALGALVQALKALNRPAEAEAMNARLEKARAAAAASRSNMH
jgi:tetratricopeptide (TPR) repeat protein